MPTLSRRLATHLVALVVCLVAACGGGVEPSNGRQTLPTIEPERAGTGVIAEASGEITRLPESSHGLIVGVPYEYRLAACEAHQPIDLDGALWDAKDPTALTLASGAHGYVTLMSPTTAVFRADDGSVFVWQRHAGAKTFPTDVCNE